MLAKRTQEQLEEIVRRKQSLSLDLKRATPAFLDDDCSSNDCDETAFSCNSRSFQEPGSRKYQIVSNLNLLPQSIPSSDTVETFHTAAADSPELRITFENADTTCISDLMKNEFTNEEQDGHLTHDDRSSSTVETKRAASTELMNDEEKKAPMVSTIPENMLQDTLESPIQQNPAMKRLNQRIARQRMMVMRCLDAGTPSKDDLNRQIMILQDLQRQQIELEVSLLEDERKSHSTKQLQCGGDGDNHSDRLVSNETEDYVQNEPNAYCSVVEPTNNSSAILLTVAQTRSQLFRNNRPNTNDQESLSEASKRSSGRGYSTVYLTVSHRRLFPLFLNIQSRDDFTDTFFAQSQNRGDRLSSPYSLTITRSLPSLLANDGDCVINMIVSVPSYVIRGAGASSHYEYEVRVVAQDDSWTLLRRYRRFRELYVSMRQKYGSKVRYHLITMQHDNNYESGTLNYYET